MVRKGHKQENPRCDEVKRRSRRTPLHKPPEVDDRPIGKLGWMHRAYLEETNPLLLNHLPLTGKLHTYLADLNEQVQDRYRLIVRHSEDFLSNLLCNT